LALSKTTGVDAHIGVAGKAGIDTLGISASRARSPATNSSASDGMLSCLR
jgi:hypothetical protein